ncbi:MAG: hypothetical protein J1D77_00140 [Muribaculaceae bacterium]|nr:hypothetical protein [Muribaculaceae bacterium]
MRKFSKVFNPGLAVAMAVAFTGSAVAAGPAIEELDGFYQFTSDLTNYQTNSYANSDGNFVFQIAVQGGSANIYSFMGGYYVQDEFNLQPSVSGGITQLSTNYDQSTGQLKINNFTGNSITGYYGFEVGEWSGFKSGVNSNFIITFNEDGTISLPDFNFITATTAGKTGTLGEYTNISILPYTPPAITGQAIEGTWSFTKQAIGSSTTEQANYKVTANGNTITFEEQNEFNDGPYFRATLGTDGKTLTFSSQSLNNSVTQKAFTNGNVTSTSSLNDAGFTAIYNEEAGTITFTENTGIQLLTNGSEQLPNGETYAYNLISATQISGLDPVLLLQKPQYTSTPETITAQFTMAYQNLDLSKVASWGVYVEQAYPNVDNPDSDEETFQEVKGCTVSVEGDIAIVKIPVIERSYYSYKITLTAYDEDGQVIVSSKATALAVNLTETIEITQVNTSVDGFTITYKVYALELSGIPADATYKMTYVPYKDAHPGNEDDDPDYETNAQYVNATYADRYFTASITVDAPGQYDYAFAFIAYDADGEEITRSNYRDALVEIADPTAPALIISNANYSVEPEGEAINILVSFNTEIKNIELEDVAEFLATFQYQLQTTEAECEVNENGVTTATLLEMPQGQYTVSFHVQAIDADGEEIADSNWIDLSIDTNSTGINDLNSENGNAIYFDLSGRKINRPENGIYIKVVNGKSSKHIAR